MIDIEKIAEGWSALYKEPATEYKMCGHDYVNVGFMHIKMVCKYCDKEEI